MRYAVVLLVALAACADDGAAVVETPRSGSRLKLAWFEFADGFRTWAPPTDLVDAELGMACAAKVWADGTSRCTPELGQIHYLDAACAMPVGFGGRMFAAELSSSAMSCGGPRPANLYRVSGASMSVASLYAKTDSGCVQMQIPGPTGHATVQPVTSVPVSTLVTMHVESRGAGPLLVDTLIGDDGFIAPLAIRDQRYDTTCDLAGLLLGSEVPCMPTVAANFDGQTFSDQTCSVPAVPVGDATCPGPELAIVPTFGCPLLYAVGAPTNDPAYAEYASCMQRYDVAGPIAPLTGRVSPLALTRMPEPDSHREQPLVIVNGTTRFRDPLRIFDSELDTECELEQHVKDGDIAYCQPPAGSDPSFQSYSDPACTMPNPKLAKGVIQNECGERRSAHYIFGFSTLYHIGARHVGNAYEQTGATCDPVLWPLFELEDIPITRVATAVKQRDP